MMQQDCQANLSLWERVRTPPASALKQIAGGRLRGMTDIHPMWRLKALTEQFGVCGIGWKYDIVEKRLERGANDEIAAFVDINLYIKVDGEWSAAIPGTGGSAFVEKEQRGLYVNDECFKMALTDAISVACKALGVAADVYWDKDATKYSSRDSVAPAEPVAKAPLGQGGVCSACQAVITSAVEVLSTRKFGAPFCNRCQQRAERT